MREYSLEQTRNIGIIAHIDAGLSTRAKLTTGLRLVYLLDLCLESIH